MQPTRARHRGPLVSAIAAAALFGFGTDTFGQSHARATPGGLDVGASASLVTYRGGTIDLGVGVRSGLRVSRYMAVGADLSYVAAREGGICPFDVRDDCHSLARRNLVYGGAGLAVVVPSGSVEPYAGVSYGVRFKSGADRAAWNSAASPSGYIGLRFPRERRSLFAEFRLRGEYERDVGRMRWPATELTFGIVTRALW